MRELAYEALPVVSISINPAIKNFNLKSDKRNSGVDFSSMDWLWYVIPILIMAATLFFKIRRQSQFKKNLPLIAESLGLKYLDRVDQLPERIAEETDLPSALSNSENVKAIQKYARVISIWRIEGEFNGVKVGIYPRVIRNYKKSQSGYTRLNAYFAQPKTLGITISNMGNTPLGKPEIAIENLNKKIIIKGVDEANTRQLLSDSDLQRAITSAFEFSPQLVIDDNGAYLDKHGPPPLEAAYYRQALDHLTRIILAFENRCRFLNLTSD